jgi:hypothetical protein
MLIFERMFGKIALGRALATSQGPGQTRYLYARWVQGILRLMALVRW